MKIVKNAYHTDGVNCEPVFKKGKSFYACNGGDEPVKVPKNEIVIVNYNYNPDELDSVMIDGNDLLN